MPDDPSVLAGLATEMPRRASRADEAAHLVEKRIIADNLPPGTRLGRRRDLQELLGVAPSTVSEAIKLLEERGRVRTQTGPGGGVFVAEPSTGLRLARTMMSVVGSADEVAEAMAVRDALERAVTLSAASTPHTAKELAPLRRSMKAVAAADADDRFLRILEFHSAVADLSSNRLMRAIYQTVLEIIRSHDPHLRVLPGEDAVRVGIERVQVHQDLADAICSGDVAGTQAALERHG